MDSPEHIVSRPETAGLAGAEVLCPLEGRRSAEEILVKLFVVHSSTIALFCHVLSIRGERIVSWKSVFYILVPFNALVSHGVALAVFGLAVIYIYLKSKPPRLYESLQRAPRWFFGLVPQERAYQQVPTTDLSTIGGAVDS